MKSTACPSLRHVDVKMEYIRCSRRSRSSSRIEPSAVRTAYNQRVSPSSESCSTSSVAPSGDHSCPRTLRPVRSGRSRKRAIPSGNGIHENGPRRAGIAGIPATRHVHRRLLADVVREGHRTHRPAVFVTQRDSRRVRRPAWRSHLHVVRIEVAAWCGADWRQTDGGRADQRTGVGVPEPQVAALEEREQPAVRREGELRLAAAVTRQGHGGRAVEWHAVADRPDN